MKKQTKYALLTISILVLLSLLVSAITFDSDPTINNLPPITGGNLSEVMSRTNLNCSWNATDSIQTNVSWYRNGVSILNKTVLSSYDIIENSQTSKGDTWNCSITITDGIPPSLTSWYAVVISNSPPEPPHVRDWNSDVVINWTHVYEDQNFLYQINSSDIDNDPLVFSVLSLESARSDLCAVLTPDNNPASIRCSPIAMDLDSIHVPTTRKVNFKVDENIEGIAYGISKTIYLNITPVNDTPIFMAGFPDDILTYQGNRTNFDYYDSGTGRYGHLIWAEDEENDTIGFSLGLPPALTGRLEIVSVTENAQHDYRAVMSWNTATTYPEFRDRGNYSINVTIFHTGNTSNNRTSPFLLEVIPVNTPPNITGIGFTPTAQNQNFTLIVNVSDVNNDTFIFNMVGIACPLSNPWSLTIVNNGTWNNTRNLSLGQAIFNNTLTNTHVACDHVNVSVTDINTLGETQETVWTNVTLNLINVNDPPVLNQLSGYPGNTGGDDMSNLLAYAHGSFYYKLNATDPDLYVGGEVLSYSHNSTAAFFDINNNGEILFTPNSSDVNNYSINITVIDINFSNSSRVMTLRVLPNEIPYFIPSLQNQTNISEGLNFTYQVNATDADADNITYSARFVNGSISGFTINTTTGLIWALPQQAEIGNHTVNISVIDEHGAINWSVIIFEIVNRNDAPLLTNYDFSTLTIVETHEATYYIAATDKDLVLPSTYDSLTFNVSLTWPINYSLNYSLGSQITGNSTSTIKFVLRPVDGDAGNYSMNITVYDSLGEVDVRRVTFNIINRSAPPNIANVTPFGMPKNNNYSNAWTVNDFLNSITYLHITENLQDDVTRNWLLFNHTTTDENLTGMTYTWYLNGTEITGSELMERTHTYNRTFDYFSAGTYNITLLAEDATLESDRFSWIVNVTNVDRAPDLETPLVNITITGYVNSFYNYFLYWGGSAKFVDPDDDLNNNEIIDGNESSGLTYNATTCNKANLQIINHTLFVDSTELGICYVLFTAEDNDTLSKTSNMVKINISYVTNKTEQQTQISGGGGTSRTITVPIPEEVVVPVPLQIITPSLISIYRNRTIRVPITIKNNWNDSLFDVSLNVLLNATHPDIKYSLTKDYFPDIPSNASEEIFLTISNYRLGENFEIILGANVSTPNYYDKVKIAINSMEGSMGEAAEQKVTFARDLLSQNPECMELQEILLKAEDLIRAEKFREATDHLEGVINGCKYLMSARESFEEQPTLISEVRSTLKIYQSQLLFAGIGLFVIISAIVTINSIRKPKKPKEEEQANVI